MTENIQDVNATTQTAPEAEAEQTPKTFTQEDVNRIVANRVSKYSDYEELKAKAAKFDEAEEAQKTELEKAQERANKLQSELDGIKAAEELRKMRDEVLRDYGNCPDDVVTGGASYRNNGRRVQGTGKRNHPVPRPEARLSGGKGRWRSNYYEEGHAQR